MEELDLKELLIYFWRKKIIIIGVIVLFGIMGILYAKFGVEPQYDASTSVLFVKTKFENEADVDVFSRLYDRYNVVAHSGVVVTKVKENLKLEDSVKDLYSSIEISPASSYGIRITVKNKNPECAANIANEIANVFMEKIKEIYQDENLKVLDIAVPNDTPINVNIFECVFKFVLIGVIMSFGIYFSIFVFKGVKWENKT